MTIIDPQDDFGPSTAERLTREFGDGANAPPLAEVFDERMGIVDMPDKNDMQARADELLAEWGADMSAGFLAAVAETTPPAVPEFPIEAMPIEAQATLAASYRDELRLADGQLELDLAPLLSKIDAARAKHAEATKAKREAVAAIENRVRAHVLAKNESFRGPYFLCSYSKPYKLITWETDKLEGFAAALDDKLKAALLAFKKETDVAASTKWKNK